MVVATGEKIRRQEISLDRKKWCSRNNVNKAGMDLWLEERIPLGKSSLESWWPDFEGAFVA